MTGTHARRRTLGIILLCAALVLSGCLGAIPMLGDGERPSPSLQFEEVTNESGLEYRDDVGQRVGAGNASVYAADVDRDGWTDLLTMGNTYPALWHNENGHFERAGTFPEVDGHIKSGTFIDFDDDGWEDLVLFRTHGEAVALHNDEGTFERTDIGLGNLSYPLGGAAADFDGDGDEDLFVYQSGDWREKMPAGYVGVQTSIDEDNGNPNLLYENDDGEFERVTDAGISGNRWSLTAGAADLNDDGHPDIYIANDYNTDVVYLNEGDGTFEQRRLGGNTSRNGMSSEISDFNGDGRPDVFVTNIELPITRKTVGAERYEQFRLTLSYVVHSGRTRGNTLLLNEGNGTFNETAERFDIQTGGWGWASSHADLNNDGRRDLIHATQHVVTVYPDDPIYEYPMVWKRTGDNFTQLDASEIGFNKDDGRGMVTLDYDRDGDLDVVTASLGSPFSVYENKLDDTRTHAIEFLAVEGDGSAAYGATIEVEAGYASRTVFQHSRTDFLSQDPRENHVGLGAKESATLAVTWPDGTERTFEDVPAGQYVHLHRNGTVETVVEFRD